MSCMHSAEVDKSAYAQKAGYYLEKGWGAYQNGDYIFVKVFNLEEEAAYPEINANVEIFTNDQMLELETLGPLTFTLTSDLLS